MALIAKMECSEVVQQGYAGKQTGEQVKLRAVYTEDKDHPNYEWSEATPSGSLELFISNPAAFGKVKAGEEFHVTIAKIRS